VEYSCIGIDEVNS